MKKPQEIFLIFTLLVLMGISCEKAEDTEPTTIEVLKPSHVSETEFQLNWSVSNTKYESVRVELSFQKDFDSVDETHKIPDNEHNSLILTDRKGATRYYYRVKLISDGIVVAESEVWVVTTTYLMENASFTTLDGLTLNGKIAYLESITEPKPGIIMMHELGVFVNPWIDSPTMMNLVSEGYVCMTFFNRGHGSSSKIDGGLMSLIEDKSGISEDLRSAIAFIAEHKKVTPDNLGLIGASMGGIMALAGNGYGEVKTSVSLSAPADGVFYIFPNMTLTSAYYLAGELDRNEASNIDVAKDAENLFKMTESPKKLSILPGISAHGTSLLSYGNLESEVLDWFLETLPIQQ